MFILLAAAALAGCATTPVVKDDTEDSVHATGLRSIPAFIASALPEIRKEHLAKTYPPVTDPDQMSLLSATKNRGVILYIPAQSRSSNIRPVWRVAFDWEGTLVQIEALGVPKY